MRFYNFRYDTGNMVNTVINTEKLIMDYWEKQEDMRKHCIINKIVINLAEEYGVDNEDDDNETENNGQISDADGN